MADTGSMIAGAGVIKDVGGQWLTKGVEEALGRLKKPLAVTVGPEGEIPRDVERNKAPAALNSWIDGALRKYVLNRMATPDDEIRALAENGVLHVDPEVLTKGIPGVSGRTVVKRQGAGFPQMGVGKSEHAVAWENTADRSINAEPAGTPGMFKALPEKDQAWISKLEPETPVHESAAKSMGTNLGFDHIIDVLGEKLATGELRPEQLSKVSVADAVRMTHGYNLDAAERMSKARLASQEGMTVHKEYPEGYKWVQLDKPGQFAAESDVMGHSVRGYEPYSGDLTESSIRYGGPFEAHPDWIPASGDSGYEDYGYGGWEAIKSGKAKVYSLRDPKGESHVTVEVGKMNQYPHSGDSIKNMLGPKGDKIWEEYLASKYAGSYSPGLVRFLQDKYPKIWKGLNEGEQISQIKGKQNRKPEDKYLPYIQDFVRSSKWGDVGDVKNTGLLQVAPNKYISDAEVEALGVKHFGINGPDSTENAAQYYTRISRMHPSIRSKADEAFIKDVEQTADKPKAALA
ncbi:MAG TPA: hypothetical protein VMW50_14960, partial [Dehalococcoidia bacterium]|nr:hypothetical protein [Dehalococcoidia bacterium]